jgi:hypothetical protein
MRTTGGASQGSEFHEFLYAPIGNDHEGMTLSVLSALARQDLDPWTEASRLAQLPEKAAAQQILDWLDVLPHRTLAGLDRTEVAGRLTALLPRRVTQNLAARLRPASTKAPQSPAAVANFNWRFFFLYFFLMLMMNWLMAVSHTPPSTPLSPAAAAAPEGGTEKPADGQSGASATRRTQGESHDR